MDSCVNGSVCFELIKGIPAALVAVAVAIPTVYIAFRQYFLARAKLKLDLFDKRMEVFNAIRRGFSFATTLGRIQNDEAEWEAIDEALHDARFLFGQDIREYIEELQTHWSALAAVYRNWKVVPDVEMSLKDSETERRVMHWLFDQASSGLHQQFSKYLSFEEWH